jgi:hypothetical protein
MAEEEQEREVLDPQQLVRRRPTDRSQRLRRTLVDAAVQHARPQGRRLGLFKAHARGLHRTTQSASMRAVPAIAHRGPHLNTTTFATNSPRVLSLPLNSSDQLIPEDSRLLTSF